MSKKYDVVIKSKSMGHGEDDEVLLEKLMVGFLHTLAGRENLPEHIIMYGSGVLLSCTGSDSIEDLKVLEEKGVKVLSCGICLDYYEIKDELKVGGVTTMAEVVEIMTTSDKVIIP
ncbi:hypothetical protein HMPREF9333_00777 [Johnsonella ignava ATCC 51276]|jgi:sirA family protein|uniref:Uncharacterized protein n=1 Tax=Johnsonella ignava ATCC 51276 TaxID=679200 RepID=G5GGT7_9FIRM|nr:sulfurtransferase-like selenium metabolism protein YedF [Johnsonella ignava]EHI55995.1 hypothetical protein HMPREF9333_00777 [Johnsonella ignava ATCC 51276]